MRSVVLGMSLGVLCAPGCYVGQYYGHDVVGAADARAGRTLGPLDLAFALEDATSYFRSHPVRSGSWFREDARPVLPGSVVVHVRIGNPTERRVAFDFSRLRFEASDANATRAAMEIYDPANELAPRLVEVHRAGDVWLRVDAPRAVTSPDRVEVRVGDALGVTDDARTTFCFARAADRWLAVDCAGTR